MTDAREIIRAALRAHGADGLVNDGRGCSCSLDDPLSCEDFIVGIVDCMPAYEKVCPCCGGIVFVAVANGQLHAKAVKR